MSGAGKLCEEGRRSLLVEASCRGLLPEPHIPESRYIERMLIGTQSRHGRT